VRRTAAQARRIGSGRRARVCAARNPSVLDPRREGANPRV
jgi:hypothetical protein